MKNLTEDLRLQRSEVKTRSSGWRSPAASLQVLVLSSSLMSEQEFPPRFDHLLWPDERRTCSLQALHAL